MKLFLIWHVVYIAHIISSNTMGLVFSVVHSIDPASNIESVQNYDSKHEVAKKTIFLNPKDIENSASIDKTDVPLKELSSNPINTLSGNHRVYNKLYQNNKKQMLKFASSKGDSYLDALDHSRALMFLDSAKKPKFAKVFIARHDSAASEPIYRFKDHSGTDADISKKISGRDDNLNNVLKAASAEANLYYGQSQETSYKNDYTLPFDNKSPLNTYIPTTGHFKNSSYNLYDTTLPQASPPSYYRTRNPLQHDESKGLGSIQATYTTSYPLPDLFPLELLPTIDLKWPVSFKINGYTLLKIVLKLIIFKMIVKFISTLCLLIFIPKLFYKKEENNDMSKSREYEKANIPVEQRQSLVLNVTKSIEYYKKLNKN